MSSSSGGGFDVSVGIAGGTNLAAAQQGQGVAALLVMLAVLCFIFAYCCWGAPFCRSLCKKHCCCRLEDPEPDPRFGSTDQAMVATPTIILLPHGRMLVVDGTVFTQFQADTTGLDLVELGESVIRAQGSSRMVNRHQLRSSQGSILEMDAETPSKESLGSLGCFPPPTYESIYGKDEADMPPSYSDILLHRFANLPYELEMQDYRYDDKEEIEMQTLERRVPTRIIENPTTAASFPYAGIVNLGQNFPQQNIVRNPTLIDNPLDEYYADIDLGTYMTTRSDSDFYQMSNVSTSIPRPLGSSSIRFYNVSEPRISNGLESGISSISGSRIQSTSATHNPNASETRILNTATSRVQDGPAPQTPMQNQSSSQDSDFTATQLLNESTSRTPNAPTSRFSDTLISQNQTEEPRQRSSMDFLNCDGENNRHVDSSRVQLPNLNFVNERTHSSDDLVGSEVINFSSNDYSSSSINPSPVPSFSDERAEEVFGALTDIRESRV